MKNQYEIKEEIKRIKSQIGKVQRMKNKEPSEVWLRGYWTSLNWVLRDSK